MENEGNLPVFIFGELSPQETNPRTVAIGLHPRFPFGCQVKRQISLWIPRYLGGCTNCIRLFPVLNVQLVITRAVNFTVSIELKCLM